MATLFSTISQHDAVIQCDTVSLWVICFFVIKDSIKNTNDTKPNQPTKKYRS